MLVSGATAFLYEVLWTRMLTHVMGGSIYAFATMLAAFLTGIALGGGLAGKVAENRERAALGFAFTQVAIGALSMGVYAWMGPLIPDTLTTFTLAVFGVAVMLPATIFIGATLPLAVRVLARDESQATTGTARIYAWNTVGAIVGAILAGFILIPELGFEGSIRVAVAINFVLALWAAVCVAKPRPIPVALACTGIAAVLLIYHPARPQAVVSSTGFVLNYLTDPEEIYYDVGRTSTVLVLAEGSYYYVRTNGLPEASIAARGSPPTPGSGKVADRAGGGRAPRRGGHAGYRLRRRRGAGGRAAVRGPDRRRRTRTESDRGEPPTGGPTEHRSAGGSALQHHHQRCPQRASTDPQDLRRHRLPALPSVDGGCLASFHP